MPIIKRALDIFLSLIGLFLVLPFFPIIGLLIKLDSRGPVFYLANRIGKDGKIFKMYKFRTMQDTPIEIGQSVSPQYDPRVTSFGRFLRRTKMNELPQFVNILKGDMTFVGPRPEAPDLAELYPPEAKKVFSVKPGLVGPNLLYGRNEEELFPPGVDAKKYYIEKILPPKNKLDLEYIANPSLWKDFALILLGVKETLIGSLSKRQIQYNRSQILLLLGDGFMIFTSSLFAYSIAVWNSANEPSLYPFLWNFPIVLTLRLICFLYFGLYSVLIKFISYHDIIAVLKAVACSSALLFLVDFTIDLNGYSGLIALIDLGCLIYLLLGVRLSLILLGRRERDKSEVSKKRRVLIYGAGEAGNATYWALAAEKAHPFEIVGFVDDAPEIYGKSLNGVKVIGNRFHIAALARLHRAQEVLIPHTDQGVDNLPEIIKICQEAGLKYRFFSPFNYCDPPSGNLVPGRKVQFSDILPLKTIEADPASLKEILFNQTIMINGTGGALGLELSRKLLQKGCRKIIIMERFEAYLNEVVSALLEEFSPELIVPVVNTTGEKEILDRLFLEHRPGLVFHAGMRKYVPFLGVDLSDLGRINYLHTFNLAKMAAKYRTGFFVMISSLNAGKGGNLVSDSLRIAELSLDHFFSDTDTRLVISRLCDIVENRGGIVSVLEQLLKEQNPPLWAHKDTQVSLLSKSSAAEFILQTLIEVNRNPSGRNVFDCEAGPPVSINEIIEKLIYFQGLRASSNLSLLRLEEAKRAPSVSSSNLPAYRSFLAEDPPPERQWAGILNTDLKSALRQFVLGENGESCIQDWQGRTQELISLYKNALLSSHTLSPEIPKECSPCF